MRGLSFARAYVARDRGALGRRGNLEWLEKILFLVLRGYMWRGIGEHWVGVGLANLQWPEKILFLVLRGIGIGVCVGGCMALCVELSEDDADWAGRELG